MYTEWDLKTSPVKKFPSSTEESKVGLSEDEVHRKIDPPLLEAILGPDLYSVLSFYWEGARDNLASSLNEYEDS